MKIAGEIENTAQKYATAQYLEYKSIIIKLFVFGCNFID